MLIAQATSFPSIMGDPPVEKKVIHSFYFIYLLLSMFLLVSNSNKEARYFVIQCADADPQQVPRACLAIWK